MLSLHFSVAALPRAYRINYPVHEARAVTAFENGPFIDEVLAFIEHFRARGRFTRRPAR